MKQWKTIGFVFVLGAILGSIGLSQLSFGDSPLAAIKQAPTEPTSFRHVVKDVLPAVVSIQAVSRNVEARGPNGRGAPFGDQDLEDFFGPFGRDNDAFRRQLEEMFRRQQRGRQRPQPQPFGSGVVIDPSGIIVTNNHVVANADEIQVIFSNGTRYTTKDYAGDQDADLAIIRLKEGGPFPHVGFGDSDGMEIGDRVLAFGAPFGLQGSVTSGIISSKGRQLHMGNNPFVSGIFEDFLQTDAAINPGNSGGPLINMDGKIVGINTAIRSRNGGFQGVGMAIASNLAKEIVPQLIENGRVQRGYLGVTMQDLTDELSEKFGVPGQKGVLINRVNEDGPADKSGLQQEDIIVKFNEVEIDSGRKLQRAVSSAPVGKSLPMTIVRGGKKREIKVTLDELPKDFRTASLRAIQPVEQTDSVRIDALGIELQDLTPELARRLNIEGRRSGAVVASVDADGRASGALNEGDLVLEIEREPVSSAEEAKALLDKASIQEGIMFKLRTTGGGIRFVVLSEQ